MTSVCVRACVYGHLCWLAGSDALVILLLLLVMFVRQIGDFGMSRGMESDHYESSGGVIPVKWSAPEVNIPYFPAQKHMWLYLKKYCFIWNHGTSHVRSQAHVRIIA